MNEGFRRARTRLNEIKTNRDQGMIAIGPRRIETAALADLYLQLLPGTDMLLGVPIGAWIEHAVVSRAGADCAVDMIFAAGSMVILVELGLQQGRHSTLDFYLKQLPI